MELIQMYYESHPLFQLLVLHKYNPSFSWLTDIVLFYYGFVIYSGCYNAIKQRKWLVVLPCIPIILYAGLIDVVFNQTIGRLLFLELKNTWTLSGRIDLHYVDIGWRGRLARELAWGINTVMPGHITGES